MAHDRSRGAGRVWEDARRRHGMLLLGVVLAAAPCPAGAQLAVGRVELVMHAADTATHNAAIGVRNESTRAVQAMVRLEDWDRGDDGANRWFPYGSRPGRGSCAPALTVFPQSMRLEPGAVQSLRVVLDRSKAPPGECWAAAIVETVQPGDRPGQRVAYVVRTAVKIYVQAADLTTDGEIDLLRVVPDNPRARSAHVEVAFRNSGTRHVTAQGTLEVRTPDNAVVTRVPLPHVYALPGARHAVRVPMPSLKPGRYVLLATMDYGGVDIAAALLEHQAR